MPQQTNTRLFQRVVLWSMVGLVLYFIYRVVKPFLVSLTWAAILTIFFFPLHRLVRSKIRRPNVAAFVTVIVVAIVLVVPLGWLVPAFVSEALAVFRFVPSSDFLPRAKAFLEQFLAEFPIPLGNLEDVITQISQKAGALLAQQSARIAGNVAMFVFDLFVMLLAMFYLFRDGPRLLDFVKDISPLGGEHRDRMMQEVTDLISVTISSGLVVAAVQGLLGGLVFWMLGLKSPVFWGVIIALLAFLPVIGPWLVWAPAGVGLILNGGVSRGITLLIVGFLLVSGADNVLRPILISGRAQLNGLLVFVSVLGGIQAFGFLGVVLGPLVVATAVGLLKGYGESIREQRILGPSSEAA